MMRCAWIWVAVAMCAPAALTAQVDTVPRRHDGTLPATQNVVPRATGRRAVVHYGKWLAAGTAVAFTALAAHEHRVSRTHWDALLVICRSADDACVLGADDRYVNGQAERLYQSAMSRDRRANTRLLGAQAGVLLTAAMFILDLRGRSGEPDNIPLAPVRVTVEPTRDGAAVGVRLTF